MTTTFTAIDAAVQTHKRTSKSRSYTHTVVALRSYSFDLDRANSKVWDKEEGKNFDYYSLIAFGNDPHPCRCYRTPDRWTAEQIAEEAASVEAMNAKRITDAADRVTGHTRETYLAARRADRVARVEKAKAEGRYAQWENLGWCGRLDLAQKLASRESGPRFTKIEILPAN